MCACDYGVSDEEYSIKKLCYKFRKKDSLSHRDFLGSLMGLGIERSCVGDIIVGDGCAAVFAKGEVSGFIESQLSKV
ncbi:MAG: RNA-binding protein, partial [Ruminococcus sp.]|nr:RNA-binding protein [Ruminococcus sp.]